MKKRYKIYLFCFVTGIYWFSMYAYVPILTPYASSLGTSYKMVGLIAGSYGLSQALVKIPLGIMSDAIRRRKIFIIAGMALSAASSFGIWFFPNAYSLLICRTISGVAASPWVIYPLLFASYFKDDNSGKAMGIIVSVNFAGQVAASFFGGIAAQQFGPEYTFLLSALVGLVGLLLSFFLFEEKSTQSSPVRVRELIDVAKDVNLIVVSILGICLQILIYGTIYGFTPVAAKSIGATDFQLGMITTIFTVPIIFSSALSGTFFDKVLGKRSTIVLGFILISLTSIITPLIKSIYIFYVVQAICGFGRGLIFTLLMDLSIRNIELKKRGTAMGVFQAFCSIGMFIGPVLVGFLSDTISLSWGFVVIGIIGILSSLFTFYYVKSYKPAVLKSNSVGIVK